MHRIVSTAIALTWLACLASTANAQASGGYRGGSSDNPNGPTVSPYLNLLNTNSQGISSYQTLVKPMIEQQNAIQRQGNAIQRVQQQVNQSPYTSGSQRGTGHTSVFMNYSHFYPVNSRR